MGNFKNANTTMEIPEIATLCKEIGFEKFSHLKTVDRDGKNRLVWMTSIKNHSEWFSVRLVETNNNLIIEHLENPLGRKFEQEDVLGLLIYIKDIVLPIKQYGETD